MQVFRRSPRAAAALSILGLIATSIAAQPGMMFAPGDPMPDLRGWTAGDGLYIVDFASADYTLVNFWADWCEPCKDEMPMLQRAHERLGAQGLQVIGVTSEPMAEDALGEFVAAMELTYPIFRIADESKRLWPGVRGTLPNSFLVDREGKLVRRYVGASEAQIAALEFDLEAVLAGKPLGKVVLPDSGATSSKAPDKAN